jgi:hypothetical protein
LLHLIYEYDVVKSNVIFPKVFSYDFFLVELVKENIDWMSVEYNDLSFTNENCKNSPRNIMLIPPNDKMLDFNFCSCRCIVTSKVQLTIDILSIMMNWISNHMSIIEVGLFTFTCLSIDNPDKAWIVDLFMKLNI